jgi:hypothetical protein
MMQQTQTENPVDRTLNSRNVIAQAAHPRFTNTASDQAGTSKNLFVAHA